MPPVVYYGGLVALNTTGDTMLVSKNAQAILELLGERSIRHESHQHPNFPREWVIIAFHNDQRFEKIQVITPTTRISELWWLS